MKHKKTWTKIAQINQASST